MIKTKKDLKEWLALEKCKYLGNKSSIFTRMFGVGERVILWRFQKILRKYEYHLNNNHRIRKIFFKYKWCKYKNKYGLLIPPNTTGKGLRIMHLGSIAINENARIGENCAIHINTAFVARGNTNECPIIGDNSIVSIGAIIVGNVKLGNYVVVGAGSVVTKSFEEDHITVVGVPARLISNKGSEQWGK